MEIFVDHSPIGVLRAYYKLFTQDAINFIADLAVTFRDQIEKIYIERKKTNVQLLEHGVKFFSTKHSVISNGDWTVDPVPAKLKNRYVDLGDVSPVDTHHFVKALRADVDGIQVDFDDGHCPTWKNQILGHYNLHRAVRGNLPNVPDIREAPTLMVRPRAWNMTEYHMMVNGRPVPGPIFDFGLHMFHNGRLLYKAGVGPFFYLSKLESPMESRLWNDIFITTQEKIGIPQGTIKACILIENIVAATQMEEMLYEIRTHSIGLNCGIWDYCASIISKFGRSPDFVLPDRNKYVNVDRHFLRKYMELTVHVCHKRGTFATSGMATRLVDSREAAVPVVRSKKNEIEMGFDGFLVYDVNLVGYVRLSEEKKQSDTSFANVNITINDLLQIPKGGVTMEGLEHNIRVSVLFIANWLDGVGHFELNGIIEDSATAEISRMQVWQWLRHGVSIENSSEKVDIQLVQRNCQELAESLRNLRLPAAIFLELVTLESPPEFITTYLSDSHIMRHYSPGFASHL